MPRPTSPGRGILAFMETNQNQGQSEHEQVKDTGTVEIPGEQVANAAAESLHGTGAAPEMYAQPDARVLPGGGTLIAEPGDETKAGELREKPSES